MRRSSITHTFIEKDDFSLSVGVTTEPLLVKFADSGKKHKQQHQQHDQQSGSVDLALAQHDVRRRSGVKFHLITVKITVIHFCSKVTFRRTNIKRTPMELYKRYCRILITHAAP